MDEWTGYCSHDPKESCANCKTYYVVPNTVGSPRLSFSQLLLVRTWLGRTPVTVQETEEVEGLRLFLAKLIEQTATFGQPVAE
jgi:hypothetical protein